MPGIYISVRPTDKTLDLIHGVLSKFKADIPFYTDRDLHVTIIHQSKPRPSCLLTVDSAKLKCKPERILRTSPLEVQPWNVTGGTILVIKLTSMDLLNRFRFWNALGLHSDFSTYSPHMTISGVVPDEVVRDLPTYIQMINQDLLGMSWDFEGEKAEEAKDNWKPKKLKVEAKKSKSGKGRKRGKLPPMVMPRVPLHHPELDDDEEQSLATNGFNHKSLKRVSDGLDSNNRWGKRPRDILD